MTTKAARSASAFQDALNARKADVWSAVTGFMDHAPELHGVGNTEQQYAEVAAA